MKYTNLSNLPDALFRAVTNDPYNRGPGTHLSVTQLIAPPRKVALEEKHADELVEDALDRIWSVVGQSVHTLLERANVKDVAERRLSVEVENWKISGAMDLYSEDGILYDYKVQSVWRFVDGVPDEIIQQLNCYAEILRQNGHPVKALKCVAILRDWSKPQSLGGGSYPSKQVLVLDVPLWPEKEAKSFIRSRVQMHQLARTSLPECSDEDRWAKNEYAVMKVGRKSAVKRMGDDKAAADALAASLGKLHYVELRQDATRRCNYCAAAPFCAQFKALSSQKSEGLTEPGAMSVAQ